MKSEHNLRTNSLPIPLHLFVLLNHDLIISDNHNICVYPNSITSHKTLIFFNDIQTVLLALSSHWQVVSIPRWKLHILKHRDFIVIFHKYDFWSN